MARELSWSYSKLKNYETCPRRHNEVDLLKNYKDGEGEAMLWGNQCHAALAQAVSGIAALPATMSGFADWVTYAQNKPFAGPASLLAYLATQPAGMLYVEQKYAITRDFQPRPFFGVPDIWYRGIADVVNIWGKVARTLDWKTGKILKDPVQLALTAQCIFSKFPDIEIIIAEYIWLADDAKTTQYFFRASMADLWLKLLPRVGELETAAKTNSYPPKRGGLCKNYCPVKTCPFWGKGQYDR